MTALLKIFDFIPGFVWALLVAVLVAMTGVQTLRYNSLNATYSEYKASVVAATLEAEQQARKKENDLRQQVERIASNAQVKQQELARRADAANRAVVGLRDTIYALNARPAASNTSAAAYDHEARTARELLGACAEEYRSVAENADGLRNQVTALQEYAVSVSKNERTQ